MELQRAQLGIDGNCGFALLGENIQEGEAEFIEIATDAPAGSSVWAQAAELAAGQAYAALKKRLAPLQFTYYLGESHPRSC